MTENTILADLAWKTEQKFWNSARVSMNLLHESTSFTPFSHLTNPKEIKTLTFEYPEQSFNSPQSLSELLPEAEKKAMEQLSGVRPLLPMPDLRSAPKMLVPVPMDKTEVTRTIVQELEKVVREITESPESCSSKGTKLIITFFYFLRKTFHLCR